MKCIAHLSATPAEQCSAGRVLCYGHDTMLLYTRQQILCRFGCATDIVSNVSDYRVCLVDRLPSVIVFCQTLTPSEFDEAVLFTENYRSCARFVVMYTRMPPIAQSPRCTVLAAQNGPEAFRRAVFALL